MNELASYVLLKHATIKKLRKNQIVLNQGEKVNVAYILLSGSVVSKATTKNGKEIILNQYSEGEIINLVNVFSKTAIFPVDILSTTDSELAVVKKEKITQNRDLLSLATEQLSELLYNHIENVLILNDGDADSKVSYYISKHQIGETILKTHSEIAQELLISRSQVSKALKRLEKKNFISMNHKKIEVISH